MSKTPNIRFDGFSDNWKEKQLSEIFVIKNNKNKNQYSRDGVLSVSDYEGCVNQIKFHGRSFAGKDISNYKIADIGDIIYTKSPLQSKPYGIVKIVTEEAGIVSPLYVVNVPTKENDSLFMYYLFDSPERTNKYLEPLVRKGAKNTMNISDTEWLSGNVVVSENLEEQQKIGLLFKKIDDLINVESSKIDKLSIIKQSLLLKMFPSKNADVPGVRFKDFTDTWEQCKLSDITTSYSGGTPQVGNSEYYNGEIPFIRSGEIYDLHTELFITQKGLNNSSAKMVSQGDILYALYGATSGEVNRINFAGAINQAILAIIPNENNNPDFLVEYFRKEKNNIISKYLQGGQGNLSAQIIKDLKISVPSFEEQNKIGNCFSQINNLITLHQRKLDKLKEVKSALLDKLLV